MVDNDGTGWGSTAIIGVPGKGDYAISSGKNGIGRTHAIVPSGMTIVGKGTIRLVAPPEGENSAALSQEWCSVVEE